MTVSTLSMPWLARTQPIKASVEIPASPDVPNDVEARGLATAIARGDESAFRRLYDLYKERLFRFGLVLARGNEQLARETVQSVFVTAAARLRCVDSEPHLWNWLARVARQHLAKSWRQHQREAVVVAMPDLPDTAETRETDTDLEEGLDAALLLMDADDRQIIEWFYFDHLSHKELAERLGATPKAISSRLERARAKLKILVKRKLSE